MANMEIPESHDVHIDVGIMVKWGYINPSKPLRRGSTIQSICHDLVAAVSDQMHQ